jgi:putative DNA primase/helicase
MRRDGSHSATGSAATAEANGTSTALAANVADGLPVFSGAHREKLAASGLTCETIRDAGIRSTGDVGEIAALLNRQSVPRTWGPCLVFPYSDESGTVVLHRVRPNNPPNSKKKGKPQKYIQPSGVPVRLYVPPSAFAVLPDATARLIVTEGELKALAATQAGFHCVGLAGVDCWHARGKLTLLPDLARIAWKDRPVFIAFDSDAADNENVRRNERELAAVLQSHGAKVKIVRIPPGAGGAKMGVDDFLVVHGAAEFQRLLHNATDPEPPDAGELKGAANDADPAIEAEHILAACKLGKLPRLRFWRGSWWWWSGGCYREKPPEEVRAELVNRMNERWLGVKARIVSDVLDQLKAKAILPSSVEPPAWLNKPAPHGWPADECLATRDAIVHLPSLVAGREPCQAPASPALLTTTATEFRLDAQAPPPDAWLKFLGELWDGDAESITTLQDWFGYCLTHDTRQHKGLLLIGPPRGGKGTIGRIQTALIGKDNIAAPTLAGLGTNFGLWPLIDKSLAIISDARLSGRADQAAVVERLLSIIGEDSITVDRKFMPPITLRLPTRIMMLTNELPRLSDASGAIVSRFILLRTTKSWLGREDHSLEKRLLAELPSILLWAVGGWRRLRDRGRFLQPRSATEALEEMADLASPVSAFVRECCRVGPGETVEKESLFAAWQNWCERQGRGEVCRHAGFVWPRHPGCRSRRSRADDGASTGSERNSTWVWGSSGISEVGCPRCPGLSRVDTESTRYATSQMNSSIETRVSISGNTVSRVDDPGQLAAPQVPWWLAESPAEAPPIEKIPPLSAPEPAKAGAPHFTIETVAIDPVVDAGECDRCGSTEFVDVPIHDGQSTRRDCAKCQRFHSWPKWTPEAERR